MIRRLRCFLVFFLVLDLCAVLYLAYRYLDRIPNQLYTMVGEQGEVELPYGMSMGESVEVLQVTNQAGGFSMVSEQTGDYRIPVKLFGVLPVKQVDVKVLEKMKLAPSGEPIGIYVATKGLLVLDTAEIQGNDGLTYAPGENILKSGDYILKWDRNTISTIDGLDEEIQKTADKKVPVLIRRNGEEVEIALKPIRATDNKYKIGAWVREDTQGIGTLTYVTEKGEFGTLGHGITDADTGNLLDLKGGELYHTKILGVVRGASGEPGELQGYINMVAQNQIGEIRKNTSLGVFGKMEENAVDEFAGQFVPVGMKQEIKKGEAHIYIKLNGDTKKYSIEIEKININSRNNKSMVIHITDPRLLSATGGIVQGMSGSPILQNGKIIGAVTHVLVDDPTRGYGIFIENMLAQ